MAPRHVSLNPLRHEVVHPRDMENLKFYKYSGLDHSVCSRLFLQRYWTWAVSLVPLHVAPNALTLLGLCVSLSSVLVVALFGTGPDGAAWVWLYAAAGVFLYQTLDSIDGKQARRTGAGSALGELFDHGCDALFSPLLQGVCCVALGYDAWRAFLHCFFVNTGLLLSIFEQYSTGTLDLGYINGPVEGVLITVASFLITFVKGVAWWGVDCGIELPLHAVGIPATLSRPNDFILLFTIASFCPTVAVNLWNAVVAPKAHATTRRAAAFFYHMAVAAVFLGVRVSLPEAVFEAAPLGFDLMYGLLASFTATRLTVARLCLAPYRPISVPYLVTVGVLLAAAAAVWLQGGAPPELAARLGLWAVMGTVAIVLCFIHAIVAVFRQFADHLGCNILSLTVAQKKKLGLQ